MDGHLPKGSPPQCADPVSGGTRLAKYPSLCQQEKPSAALVAASASTTSAAAAAPTLASFGFAALRGACCGANIWGVKYSCGKCHRVVDEACMQLVEFEVQCFTCTCRACGDEVTSHTIECWGCHFRVHAACTTDGICLQCANREPASHLGPKAHKFNHAWQLTRPWLQCDAVCVLMWCECIAWDEGVYAMLHCVAGGESGTNTTHPLI